MKKAHAFWFTLRAVTTGQYRPRIDRTPRGKHHLTAIKKIALLKGFKSREHSSTDPHSRLSLHFKNFERWARRQNHTHSS
jgi:hypothetical protein